MKAMARATAVAAVVLAQANALADCDYETVKWLQSLRFTPAEAMSWCEDPARVPAAAGSQPANAQPAQAQPLGKPAAKVAETNPPAPPAHDDPQAKNPTAPDDCPADPTAAAKGKAKSAGKNCVQNSAGGVNALSSFKMSSANGSSLATAHIATAYTPILQERKGCIIGSPANDWCKALGLDISASLPIQSATLQQYGKQAILTLDGGVINLYSAFTGGRNTEIGPYANLRDPVTHELLASNPNPRVGSFDRIYFAPSLKDPLEGLMYLKQGFGLRGVKTALTGNGMAGLATGYLGVGYDGPLFADPGRAKYDARTGWMVIEAYGTGNAINHRTMEALFGAPTSRSGFFTLGGRAKIGLPGKFFLSIEYAKAFGSYAKAHVGDTSIVSFGYNNDDSSTTPQKKAE